MQFEQQNPVEQLVESYQFQDAELTRLVSTGPKSLITLRRLFKDSMNMDVMNQIQSVDEMTLECFRDWRRTFEVVLALYRVAPQAMQESDLAILNMLAQQMFVANHQSQAMRRLVAGFGIATLLAATPWLLYKFGWTSAKKQ